MLMIKFRKFQNLDSTRKQYIHKCALSRLMSIKFFAFEFFRREQAFVNILVHAFKAANTSSIPPLEFCRISILKNI
ncbi:hypothetical protein BpHYR1_050119 [Brachionus plicatilis]|uniref:Uncharacterized protein n=1 Tax=Brachionus plicatilis TaxID=10195 RepID=A0A3M7RCF5_BRAPC|nr:hypothetical protein BpHYR1_050119 [Brachionus plicatilis]